MKEHRTPGFNKKPLKCKWCGQSRKFKFPHYSFCSDDCRVFHEKFVRSNRSKRLRKEAGGVTRLEQMKAWHKKRCVVCGYDRFSGALHFHHINKDKGQEIGGISHPLDFIAEVWVHPIIVVCSNCHAEIHSGVIDEWDYTGYIIEPQCKMAS